MNAGLSLQDLINASDSFNDILNGGDGDDTLVGNAGDDTLDGGAGSDRFFVFSDHKITLTDTQVTGDGTDAIALLEYAHLTGDNQRNTIDASSTSEISTIVKGNGGYDTLRGGEQNDITLTDTQVAGNTTDTIISIEDANLYGGDGANVIDATNANNIKTFIKGNGGNDTLYGGAKNDAFQGNAGHDILEGNGGNDTLIGGGGRDHLSGGNGNDSLNGGAGADLFVLEAVLGTDVINDFSDGVDSFGLSASLSWNDLSITDNAEGTATLIRNTTNNNQLLAIIHNVSAADITVNDFISI